MRCRTLAVCGVVVSPAMVARVLVVVVGLGGCVGGIGPELTLRSSGKVAVGWHARWLAQGEYASHNYYGVAIGQSVPLGAPGFTSWAAAEGMWAIHSSNTYPQFGIGAPLYLTGSLGGAFGECLIGPVVGASGMLVVTASAARAFILALGLRWTRTGFELYVSPELDLGVDRDRT